MITENTDLQYCAMAPTQHYAPNNNLVVCKVCTTGRTGALDNITRPKILGQLSISIQLPLYVLNRTIRAIALAFSRFTTWLLPLQRAVTVTPRTGSSTGTLSLHLTN